MRFLVALGRDMRFCKSSLRRSMTHVGTDEKCGNWSSNALFRAPISGVIVRAYCAPIGKKRDYLSAFPVGAQSTSPKFFFIFTELPLTLSTMRTTVFKACTPFILSQVFKS